MKPILRNLRTGLYFQGGATWTHQSEDALAYPDIEAAIEAAYSSSIEGLELNLLLFDDPRYTVRVALDRFFSKASAVVKRRLSATKCQAPAGSRTAQR